MKFIEKSLVKKYEAKQLGKPEGDCIEQMENMHKEIQDTFNKQLKLEKQRMARDYKSQISEHVILGFDF